MAATAGVKKAAPTTKVELLKPAPITTISKYRALMLVCAVELGWTHTQISTHVDQYTKGDQVITLGWGTSALKSMVSATKGQTPELVEGKGSMLQRAQTQLGKPMELTKKWPKLTPGKVAELENLAEAKFKIKG